MIFVLLSLVKMSIIIINIFIIIIITISAFSIDYINSYSHEIVNNSPQLQEKPYWLKTCSRHNPNENQCFQHLFEACFPALANGIPEIGVDRFEPLHIDQVAVSKGSGNLILTGAFNNLIVHGSSNASVKRANLDLNKKSLDFDVTVPILDIQAQYNIKGKILLLPILGNGDVNLTLKDLKSSVNTKIQLKQQPEETIHIDELKMSFIVGSMHIHLDNLFNGSEVLAASMNSFINRNSHEIIEELRLDLENGLSDIFHGLWNNFFSKVPIKLWLL